MLDTVQFVAVIGLIFILLVELHSYNKLEKKIDAIEELGKAVNTAFGAVSMDMVQFNGVMQAFDQRLEIVEKALLIADRNDALFDIRTGLIAEALLIDESKFKRIGEVQSLGIKN